MESIVRALWGAILDVLQYPLKPVQRVYWVYLLTSVLFAAWVYVRSQRSASPAHGGLTLISFIHFLFPAKVWRSPSAWLDVRYFFFHQIFRFFIYGSMTTAFAGMGAVVVIYLATGALPALQVGKTVPSVHWALVATYVVFSALVLDFVAFLLHYWQHKNPLLWEFHKVHHSLEVMHPLSNYREHPIDNLLYGAGIGLMSGILGGSAILIWGGIPASPALLGIGVVTFAFNFLAYNLRHSHVWLRWRPEVLNRWLACPAHHQVHHSSHPDHIDKNFGFQFAVWDVLFRTYVLPKTNDSIRFGLDTGEERDYRSCLGLYFLPLKKLWEAEKRKRMPGKEGAI